ncbi:MAG: glutathione S-transferase N-terminal domain-containing protein [Pseudomonadota bacterium]
MTIQIYDLCGRDDSLRFSPYCWRAKMAMHHKGLPFEGLPWRFTETERLAESGQQRVPVIVDGDRIVSDSWQIALYLDETYPDKPALMADTLAKASARFLNVWADTTLFGPLAPLAVKAVHAVLDPKDAAYFQESREKRLGKSLDEFCSDGAQAGARAALRQVLRPVEAALEAGPFLGGNAPYYGDYIVFGTLMWPNVVSPKPVFKESSRVADWFDRLLDLHGGAARNAPTVRS